MQDADYTPPFSDFNVVIDNHGAAVNVTVPIATARIKFRYSAKVDPAPVLQAVHAAAQRCGVQVSEAREGSPPELPVDHPLVRMCVDLVGKPAETAPYGTDASELQAIAPCVVLGPGDIAEAHTPNEKARIADLEAAVPVFMQLAERGAIYAGAKRSASTPPENRHLNSGRTRQISGRNRPTISPVSDGALLRLASFWSSTSQSETSGEENLQCIRLKSIPAGTTPFWYSERPHRQRGSYSRALALFAAIVALLPNHVPIA